MSTVYRMWKFLVPVMLLCGSWSTAFAYVDMSVDVGGRIDGIGGSTYAYTLKIKNQGNQKATSVTSTMSFSTPVTIVNSSSPCFTQGNTVRCNYSSLTAGAVRNHTINVIVPTSGTFTVSGSVAASGSDTVPGNNNDTQVTQLYAAPPAVVMNIPQNVYIEQCSGSAPLTWSMCVPSSLIINNFTLMTNNYAEFYEPGYTGEWYQPLNHTVEIHAIEQTSNMTEAIYYGTSVSPTCYEGIVSYPLNTGWYGAFRMCLQ